MFLLLKGEFRDRLDVLYYKPSKSLDFVTKSIYQKKKLSEIAELQRGRFSHRPRNDPKFYGGEYPFIQTGDIVKASNEGGEIPFSQTLNELGLTVSKLFEPNILVMTIAANIGDTAILSYPACFPDSLVTIRPKTEELDVRYLDILFKYLKEYLNEIAPQAAQKNINLQQLSPVPIVIPPVKTQQTIINIFENAYAEKKAKEAQAKALLESIDGYLLEELGITLPEKQANTLKNRVFLRNINEVSGYRMDASYWYNIDFLNSQEGNFKVSTFKTILREQPQYGANESAVEYVSGEKVRYIRITDINDIGELIEEDWKTASTIDEKYLLEEGDLLFARSGATAGKCLLYKSTHPKSIFAGYLIRFKVDRSQVLPEYIFYFTQSFLYQHWVKTIQRPSAQPNINSQEYLSLKIPVPPLEIQEKIVVEISTRREQAQRLQAEAKAVLENAKIEVERMILGGGKDD